MRLAQEKLLGSSGTQFEIIKPGSVLSTGNDDKLGVGRERSDADGNYVTAELAKPSK